MVFRVRCLSFIDRIQINASKYFTAFTNFNLRRSGTAPTSQTVSDFPEFPSNLRAFTLADLNTATENFDESTKIGEGGFGEVYRGIIQSLDDPVIDVTVAVKRSKKGNHEYRQWVTEVEYLGQIKHPNLVELIGYCNENNGNGNHRILVYEYMPKGSLDDYLSPNSNVRISWRERLKIAQHAADGLKYLHDRQLIFRDFKPSNILLDHQMNAKLSDFGVVREGPKDGRSHVSTLVVGTKGYAAPEYVQTGRLTSSCDVWSYGIFLREMITGQRDLSQNTLANNSECMRWICCYEGSGRSNLEADPSLKGRYTEKSMAKMFSIAEKCLDKDPKLRPTMTEVLDMVNDAIVLENQQPMNGDQT